MRKIFAIIMLFCAAAVAQEVDNAAQSSTVDSLTAQDSVVKNGETSPAQALSPFGHLGRNMLGSALSWPLGFHMLGGALTYRLSMENNDLMVARFAARHNGLAFNLVFGPGMLMGASIGWYIGNTFYKDKVGKKPEPPKDTVAPLFYDDTKGAVVSLRF